MNKKLLSLLVALMCVSAMGFAQEWVGEEIVAGKYFFMYNLGQKKFLAGGNNTLQEAGYGLSAWKPTKGKNGFTFGSSNDRRITAEASVGFATVKFAATANSGARDLYCEKQSDGSYAIRHTGSWPYNGKYYLTSNDNGSINADNAPNNANSANSKWYFISVEQYMQKMNETDADASGKILNANGHYDPQFCWEIEGKANLHNDKNCFELQDWDASSFTCKMSQTVTGLENGKYKLTVECQAAPDATLKVFAGTNEVTTNSNGANTWATYEVEADVTDGTLTIGGIATAEKKNQWTNLRNFKLYKLTAIDIKVANTYGTFCAPFDVKMPDEVTANKVASVSEEGVITLESATTEGVLAAGTPVILVGSANTTVYGIPTVTADAHTNGYLHGAYNDNTTMPKGSYGLQKNDGVVAFYKLAKDLTCAKYKAYLTLPETEVKVLNIVLDNETTTISSTDAVVKPMAIYSANGVKLNAMQKGLNIVKMNDGSIKKVMVK